MSSSKAVRSPHTTRSQRRRRSLGVAMVEYAFLLTCVAIPAIAGFTAGGLRMYHTYVHARNHLLLPTP